jgi:hypothetical protein
LEQLTTSTNRIIGVHDKASMIANIGPRCEQVLEKASAVCHIRYPSTKKPGYDEVGTGWLIELGGGRAIMTCHHVLPDLAAIKAARCYFFYLQPNPRLMGRAIELAPDVFHCFSRTPSPPDFIPEAKSLDYCVVAFDDSKQPIDTLKIFRAIVPLTLTPLASAPSAPAATAPTAVLKPLGILQHPEGQACVVDS